MSEPFSTVHLVELSLDFRVQIGVSFDPSFCERVVRDIWTSDQVSVRGDGAVTYPQSRREAFLGERTLGELAVLFIFVVLVV